MISSTEKTAKTIGKKPQNEDTRTSTNRQLARLSLAALGVVFGDIATSPIYAIRECFHGEYGIAVSQANVLGILSLMFWSLVMIVGLKYLMFVFRADNNGEGGVIALTALVRSRNEASENGLRLSVFVLGLFAACLLYGDGMITPAISVLSAVEGVGIISPVLAPYVIPITIAILIGLFLIQRHGTARVGSLFGPVILVWLFFLAVTGALQVVYAPYVLPAIFPWHAIQFLVFNKLQGVVVLGAVFLVVTGTEALYADMGHFGKKPIRLTWLVLVFPALVLNYFGQGAILLANPEAAPHPFYAMVPSWAMTPTVVLATLSTIIASQAVISGAFSLTRQAIQLGFLPRLNVRHTSASQIGQIYIAPVNWMLMVCTVTLVATFQSSSKLAAAYGVAVTSTMIVTTILFYVVTRRRWNWPRKWSVALVGLFLLVDIPFFAANISKLLHGAWFPIAIGAAFFTLMLTWAKGRQTLASEFRKMTRPVHQFAVDLVSHPPNRIAGDGVFLSGTRNEVPIALAKNIKHNNVLHNRTILLHFRVEDVPRVPNLKKVETEKLVGGFHRIVARHGFMEDPRLDKVLTLAREQGLDIDPEKATFYLGRESLILAEKPSMARWRTNLFIFMSRNAADASSFFGLPSDQVMEIGIRLEI
jgi:KUP system potassium uptake protein